MRGQRRRGLGGAAVDYFQVKEDGVLGDVELASDLAVGEALGPEVVELLVIESAGGRGQLGRELCVEVGAGLFALGLDVVEAVEGADVVVDGGGVGVELGGDVGVGQAG